MSKSQNNSGIKLGLTKKPESSSNKKYHKHHGRKGTSPKTGSKKASKNLYLSKCCNAPAIKEPCGIPAATKEDKNAKTGLGKWHCSLCHKKSPVSVSRVQEALPTLTAEVLGITT